MAVTRDTAKSIQQALAKAAESAGKESGLSLTRIRASYDEQTSLVRVTIELKATDASSQRAALAAIAQQLGLTSNPYGYEFSNAGKKYRVIGYETRKRSFPVLAERVADGKRVLFPIEVLKDFGGLAADMAGLLTRAAAS